MLHTAAEGEETATEGDYFKEATGIKRACKKALYYIIFQAKSTIQAKAQPYFLRRWCCAKTALAARRARCATRASPSSGAPLTARQPQPGDAQQWRPLLRSSMRVPNSSDPQAARPIPPVSRDMPCCFSCTRSHARGLMHAASCTRSGCARDATPDDFALCWHYMCTRSGALSATACTHPCTCTQKCTLLTPDL